MKYEIEHNLLDALYKQIEKHSIEEEEYGQDYANNKNGIKKIILSNLRSLANYPTVYLIQRTASLIYLLSDDSDHEDACCRVYHRMLAEVFMLTPLPRLLFEKETKINYRHCRVYLR